MTPRLRVIFLGVLPQPGQHPHAEQGSGESFGPSGLQFEKGWQRVLPRPPLCARRIPSAGRELGGCRLTSFAAQASVVLSSAVCRLVSFVHCQFFQVGVDLVGPSCSVFAETLKCSFNIKGFLL